MSASQSADFSQMLAFIGRLDKAGATSARRAIRKVVTEVGKDATARVVREADTFSDKIGPATKLRMSFAARGAGAKISTNLRAVPYARLYERGGKGSNGKYWKGPVFGSAEGGKSNDPKIRAQVKARYEAKAEWSERKTHKFFYPQIWAEKDELRTKLAAELAVIMAELTKR